MAQLIGRRTFCFALVAAPFLHRATVRASDVEVFTADPDTRHNVFTKAFNEPELLPWVVSQRRDS